MAWCRPGDKPLSDPIVVYLRIYASELTEQTEEYTIIT